MGEPFARYYKPDELAATFKVSKQTVYALLRAGKLPSVKFGKQWLVEERSLDAYLKRAASNEGDESRQDQGQSPKVKPKRFAAAAGR